jgi:RIO kinase 1
MIYKGKPVVFDLSQAVLTAHPRAKEYLQRDLSNLERYFGNFGVEVKPLDEAYEWVTGGHEE